MWMVTEGRTTAQIVLLGRGVWTVHILNLVLSNSWKKSTVMLFSVSYLCHSPDYCMCWLFCFSCRKNREGGGSPTSWKQQEISGYLAIWLIPAVESKRQNWIPEKRNPIRSDLLSDLKNEWNISDCKLSCENRQQGSRRPAALAVFWRSCQMSILWGKSISDRRSYSRSGKIQSFFDSTWAVLLQT